jgi:hypothetical protein
MIWWGGVLAPIAVVAVLAGCASTQLNYNALDAASTIDYFYIQQVLTNLVKIKEHQYAIPAQVSINTGTVSTTNQLTGSFSTPVSHAVAITNQFARIISASPSTTNTTSELVTRQNMGVTAGATNIAAQSFIFWPVYSDADQLRRLQYLYRYAAEHITAHELLCRYPVPQLESKAGPDQSSSAAGQPGLATEPKNSKDKGAPKKIYVRDGGVVKGDGTGGCVYNDHYERARYVTLKNPDPAFLYQPGCILCDKSEKLKSGKGYRELGSSKDKETVASADEVIPLSLNERLKPNDHEQKHYDGYEPDKINWLLIRGWNESVPQGAIPLGQHLGYSIYLGPNGDPNTDNPDAGKSEKKFYDFMLFILEASLLSNQPTGGKGTPSRNAPQTTVNAGGTGG